MNINLKPNRAATAISGPILTEIIRNGLVATTEEMKTNLMRTAFSTIIYEVLDFTVGLFDADGNTISISIGLPSFIRGMGDTVRAKIKHYGKENIHPGDVLLTNDAYITGSHLHHMTFTVPIFHEGDLIAFACCMGHWQDVGGTPQTFTTDIYSEGLQMPIVKIHAGGKVNEEIISIILLNVRQPQSAIGDIRAQIASLKTGERRFLELVQKYGRQQVKDSIVAIMDQSEAATRERLSEIPDGVYEAESFMDDDGLDVGKRIPMKVKVTIAGDQMTVDLSGIGDQVKGFYNSGESAGHGAAMFALRCLTSATEMPFNDGCFRPLTVILPPGKVVSAKRPAPMRWWMSYPMTIVDTIIKALSPVVPNKVAAGHHADLCAASLNGINPRNGKLFMAPGLIGGGWGAKHNEDGMNATVSMNDGDTHNIPTEQFENQYPLQVNAYRLRENSGGAGQYRGGLGTEQTIMALSDVNFNAQIDRVHCKPWGLFGGLAAASNSIALKRVDEPEQSFPNGKVFGQRLKAGDTFTRRAGGGGGYGSPLERPLDRVQLDVKEGYVSIDNARDLYGVVIDPKTMQADGAKSASLRKTMKEQGLPKDEPEA